jgi:hypothetical protein
MDIEKILKSHAHQRTDSVSDLPSKKVMERLWLVMLELYGHRWESSYGSEPTEMWARSLRGISPQQIAMGLESLHDIGEAWPPSAIEFAKMCRGNKEIGTACHKPFAFAALESDEMKQKKKEAAAVGLANLKNLMGVAND